MHVGHIDLVDIVQKRATAARRVRPSTLPEKSPCSRQIGGAQTIRGFGVHRQRIHDEVAHFDFYLIKQAIRGRIKRVVEVKNPLGHVREIIL